MKSFMISTAIFAALALPAVAQDRTFVGEASPGAIHASDLIGARIYASEATDNTSEYNGVQDDWTDIGEVNDLILSRDGKVDSVLVDIGGFLGVGERQAAVGMTALRIVSDAGTVDDPDDWFLVLSADRATIEGAPEWKMSQTGTAQDISEHKSVQMARNGYTTIKSTDLTAQMLTGAKTYDVDDKMVGEVSNLILTDAGKVTAAIIDVGGFLGMGEKPVEVKIDQLNILHQNDGSEVRVYLPLTKDQLEAMPSYTN